mgnify:CR=1 FL=1
MGTLRVDDILDSAGTGAPGFSQGLEITAGKSIKTMSSFIAATSASHTITDTDGIGTLAITTSSTNKTVTLPTASANTNRIITVKKVDSGTGTLTLSEEGTDQIDGFSSVVAPLQNDFITAQCDGSTWYITNRRYTTPWTEYTPGNLQGWGTATSINIAWRRVGESLELRGDFTTGTVTGSEAQIGFPLTLNITGDAATTTMAGVYSIDGASAVGTGYVIATSGDTYVNFAILDIRDASPKNGLLAINGNDLFSTTRMSFFCSTPISEWKDTA